MNITKPGARRPIRAGITYNLKKGAAAEPPDLEAEYDDFGTILAIKDALEAGGHAVELFEATEDLHARLAASRPDIVFNIAEGASGRGREAHIPAILNYLRIPFTGSDETTMCIAMDKALTKRLLASYHILTPKYKVFAADAPISFSGLTTPVIVKPNCEGSGMGISGASVIDNVAELRRTVNESLAAYKQEILAEEFIDGREFTVGILGNGNETRVFPPMEIIFKDKKHNIYSLEIKKNFRKFVEYECPPSLPPALRTQLEISARKAYDILKCRDLARIDFRLSQDGRIFLIEVNPLPGLAPGYSDFPMIAEFCGIGYNFLIQSILYHARCRYGLS